MAEIKSTLEKVMERAEAMGKASKAELDAEAMTRQGMKLAADFVAHREEDLTGRLEAEAEAGRDFARRGAVQALLRNVALPRDDDTAVSERAVQGLLALGMNAPDLQAIFQEIRQLLSHYIRHRQQLQQQLQDAMRQQLEQAMAQQGQSAMRGTMDPTLHPKYQEEWQRLQGDLMEQYGHLLEQHKDSVSQRFGI